MEGNDEGHCNGNKDGKLNMKRVVLNFDMRNMWEMVFEIDFIDVAVHYFMSRKKLYKWCVFYHDKTDYCQWTIPHCHYRVLLWYEPGHGSSYYFSNVPFTQFVQRKCRELGLGYVKAYDISNVGRRMRILNCTKDGQTCLQEDMSCLSAYMKVILEQK